MHTGASVSTQQRKLRRRLSAENVGGYFQEGGGSDFGPRGGRR